MNEQAFLVMFQNHLEGQRQEQNCVRRSQIVLNSALRECKATTLISSAKMSIGMSELDTMQVNADAEDYKSSNDAEDGKMTVGGGVIGKPGMEPGSTKEPLQRSQLETLQRTQHKLYKTAGLRYCRKPSEGGYQGLRRIAAESLDNGTSGRPEEDAVGCPNTTTVRLSREVLQVDTQWMSQKKLCIVETQSYPSDACILKMGIHPYETYNYSRDGDVILGGNLQLSLLSGKDKEIFKVKPIGSICVGQHLHYLRHLLAFAFAIEEINNRTDLLPNITLGFLVYDSCYSDEISVLNILRVLSSLQYPVPNYRCYQKGRLVAVIGQLMSSPTCSSASITGMYRYPQISYGALDPILNDRVQFPSLYRTVPDDRSQYEAIIQLLKHFGWTWVGIMASEDDSNMRASEELRNEIIRSGACVAFLVVLTSSKGFNTAIKVLTNTTANVIIVYSRFVYFIEFMRKIQEVQLPRKVWISSAPLIIITENWFEKYLYQFNGSLMLSVHKGEIPGLRDFMYGITHSNMLHMNLLTMLWFATFHCAPENLPTREWPVNERKCTERDELRFLDASTFDLNNLRFSYSIYIAVYAVAYALHIVYSSEIQQNGFVNKSSLPQNSLSRQTPNSVCTESCTPGYRKAPRKGQPVCCYDCVPCSEGEITTMIDMENCEPCPEDQWSNEKRDLCIPRDIVFLSYQEPLGVVLASVAILFCLITAAVMAIFIKHHKTPLVKANNRNLSYMLLLSLILSFLCSLLFIGHPLKMTCLLQQPVFGIIFTVAVSTILAKTIKVAIAFNATKPKSNLKKWLDARVSNCIILLCSLGEVVICLVWLLISPPFPDYDTKSESGKMVLKCNYGSGMAFYLVVGYMGGLAFLSFVVAFLVRKLPDSFNETQLITFSMLVFCSVWVSFIPVYLSTKGKYMVAVEIFAILTSSAGLLVFIFIPKCYIILFKPEMNTRKHLMGKQSNNDNL
ncbi:vomeronasal type-2 receptor 26-like [Rhinatrema bivittatum]|uniref:vomeronasal type-2 receptor 26-like n=1 Tax=Rhinatrema bivittatum TaxID=194408 RepID=UPI0011271967|nr:vomeronasal type-2 receptor 26-like [Rhinatrema bivittatum]